MERTDERYGRYVAILEEELVAAMGCTEPIAIALAAARARELLDAEPARVEVKASGSIIKNAKSVVVPHTGGLKGIEAAAAAGIVAGRAERSLEVIAEVSPEEIAGIAAYVERAPIAVERAASELDFDIVVRVFSDAEAQAAAAADACASPARSALVRIADFHTNIVREERDGKVLRDVAVPSVGGSGDGMTDRGVLSMEGIWDFAMTVELDDVRDLLDRQIACNGAIADEGLAGDWGANIGSVMLGAYGDDVKVRACACAAAASDARMSGCELPVVINSGSGNQGITATMPVVAAARWLDIDEEKMLRAVTLSNLIAIRIKSKFGRLSNLCGATVAGTGAACGITYLLGGGYHEICCAIQNMVGNVTGMVCDGAKADCALKISTCVNAACQAAAMGTRGIRVQSTDGIIEDNVEYTLDNFATLSTHGTSDKVILDLMLNKHLPEAE